MSSQYAGEDLFPTDYAIPDDSDARDASSVNVALEALGDRTKHLQNRTGTFRIVYDEAVIVGTIATRGVYSSSIGNTTDWVDVTDEANPMSVTLPTIKAGDHINVRYSAFGFLASTEQTAVAGLVRTRIVAGDVDEELPGASMVISKQSTLDAVNMPFEISAAGQYLALADAEDVVVSLQATLNAAAADKTIQLYKPISFMVQVLRDNNPVGQS